MAATTTICIDPDIKRKLDDLKAYKNESYNSVVERLIKMAYDEEPLTDEDIKGIEKSLEDIKAGRVYSEEEAKSIMGIED
jgi:predicted transcriptional regulator